MGKGHPSRPGRQVKVNDFIYVGLSVTFFAAAAAYAYFCEKVR
jgi:hypothetical protein